MENKLNISIEDLDATEFADELDDFELDTTQTFKYEVWLLGEDKDGCATDFEALVDDRYTDLKEVEKCFDYFSDLDNIKEWLSLKEITIPDGTKQLRLVVEEVIDTGDICECVNIADEAEIKII